MEVKENQQVKKLLQRKITQLNIQGYLMIILG